MSFARTDGRLADQLRPVRITPGFLPYAEGSALIAPDQADVVAVGHLDLLGYTRVPFVRSSATPQTDGVHRS